MSEPEPAKTAQDRARECAELYKGGQSTPQLGRRYNRSPGTIRRWLLAQGVKLRWCGANTARFGPDNGQWKGGRILNKGYVLVKARNHPRADTGGYVLEHVLAMEKHLGRKLRFYGCSDPRSETVHHINGDRQDNRIENLQVLSHAEHTALHNKGRLKGCALRSSILARTDPQKGGPGDE